MLQSLLDEDVPIRDLVRIFEALSLRAKISADHDGLVEAARAALGPAIAAQYATDGTPHASSPWTRAWSRALLEALRPTDAGLQLLVDTAPRRSR